MPNLYTLTKTEGPQDEITADGYEREGEDWVFHLAGAEAVRVPIDTIVSITRSRI